MHKYSNGQCCIICFLQKTFISEIKKCWHIPLFASVELVKQFTEAVPRWGSVKSLLKNFAKFTEIHLCQGLFIKKVAGPAPLLKKESVAGVFFKNTLFYGTLGWMLLNVISDINFSAKKEIISNHFTILHSSYNIDKIFFYIKIASQEEIMMGLHMGLFHLFSEYLNSREVHFFPLTNKKKQSIY